MTSVTPIVTTRRLSLLCAAVLAGTVLAPGMLHAQTSRSTSPSSPPSTPVRAGFLVRPDTVAVGDPFTLIVTVVVPQTARVEWAGIDDTTAVVAMRAPVKVSSAQTAGAPELRTERAEYEFAAWDVGDLPVGLPDATVRYGSTVTRVPLDDARIVVKSVLPGDTTLHQPKPARDLFPRTVPWWQQWWLAALIAALLGLLFWLWRRRRIPTAARTGVIMDPYARAIHDFDRLDRLALADAGECGRYVALALEVVRGYLVARIPSAALSLTSVELLVEIGDDARIPHDRLLSLLADADAIKFAGHAVSAARSRELALDARRLVEHVEAAERERRAAEAAVRAETANAVRAEAQRLVDDARRASRRPKAGVP